MSFRYLGVFKMTSSLLPGLSCCIPSKRLLAQDNLITVTTTPEDIFVVTGTATESQDGSCVIEAEGRGMLGDPVGANFFVKLEGWVFIPDGNGDFVLDLGTLILNFPELTAPNQAAIAVCNE